MLDFLSLNKSIFDASITIIVYLILLYFSIKGGAKGITILLSFLVVSAIFLFLKIESPLNVLSMIQDLSVKIYTLTKNIFLGFMQKALESIIQFLNRIWNFLQSLWESIDAWFNWLWDSIYNMFDTFVNGSKQVWNDFSNGVKDGFKDFTDNVKNFWDWIWGD